MSCWELALLCNSKTIWKHVSSGASHLYNLFIPLFQHISQSACNRACVCPCVCACVRAHACVSLSLTRWSTRTHPLPSSQSLGLPCAEKELHRGFCLLYLNPFPPLAVNHSKPLVPPLVKWSSKPLPSRLLRGFSYGHKGSLPVTGI